MMAALAVSDNAYYAVDDSNKILTLANDSEYSTAYGTIPMLCDELARGIHQFKIKVLRKRRTMVIGINLDALRRRKE